MLPERPDVVFSTPRFFARPWRPDEDAEGAFAMYSDPEMVRYIGNQLIASLDEQRARLRAIVDRWAPFEGRYASWPLFEKATGELVGTSLLKPPPLSGTGMATLGAEIEIGWHVVRRHWGRGIATEMGRALLVRAFDALGLKSVHALVETPNVASQKVARKIGMRHAGRTTAFYDTEVELFTMTQDEWRAARRMGNDTSV